MQYELHVRYRELDRESRPTEMTPEQQAEALDELRRIISGEAVTLSPDVQRALDYDQQVARIVKEVFGDALDTENFDSETSFFEDPPVRALMFPVKGEMPTLPQGQDLVQRLEAAGYLDVSCFPNFISDGPDEEALHFISWQASTEVRS